MKIRLLSDLHLDINKGYSLVLDKEACDYTLIAGDLGGDVELVNAWLKNNVKKGAFVSGNHDAYDRYMTPLEDIKESYHMQYPINSDITYLDYDVGVMSKEMGENILLVGDVLYTDYALVLGNKNKSKSKKERIKENMMIAYPSGFGAYMNDFNYVTRNPIFKTKRSIELAMYYGLKDGCGFLRPENYKMHFDKAFKKITEIIESNEDKNIILMTHHCLDEGCISGRYKGNDLNGSYVSNKTNWIKKHKNIKLILSGHVHSRKIYNVGTTKYVLNPLGYCTHLEYRSNIYTNKFTPNLYVNTEDWSITSEDFDTTVWDKNYEKDGYGL